MRDYDMGLEKEQRTIDLMRYRILDNYYDTSRITVAVARDIKAVCTDNPPEHLKALYNACVSHISSARPIEAEIELRLSKSIWELE